MEICYQSHSLWKNSKPFSNSVCKTWTYLKSPKNVLVEGILSHETFTLQEKSWGSKKLYRRCGSLLSNSSFQVDPLVA